MTLTTFIILYSMAGLFTGFLFWYTNFKYYGQRDNDLYMLYLGLTLFWPIGLPSFLWHYRRVIKSVVSGRDWADDADVSDEVKALMRMSEDEAYTYLKDLEERFARQISGGTRKEVQPPNLADESLN